MFIQFGPEVGYKVFTASGVFGDSGKAQAVYGVQLLSGGTAAVPCLYDGTSSLGTGSMPLQGTISVWTQNYPNAGVTFPSGCFVSFDSNTTKVIVYGRQVIT